MEKDVYKTHPVRNKICYIDKTFDFDNYFSQNKLEQKKTFLKYYMIVLKKCVNNLIKI